METDRLVLRDWKDSDLEPFSDLNCDPCVMEFFPSVLQRAESDQLAGVIRNKIKTNGWGFWAVEVKNSADFIGFVGLNNVKQTLPFAPCVEIGWRLAHSHWGKGYATEAANAVLEYASVILGLDSVVSFTAKINERSQAVMRRIGMDTDGYEFYHRDVPNESNLSRHVLFKINFRE